MDPKGIIEMILIFLEERGSEVLIAPSLNDLKVQLKTWFKGTIKDMNIYFSKVYIHIFRVFIILKYFKSVIFSG